MNGRQSLGLVLMFGSILIAVIARGALFYGYSIGLFAFAAYLFISGAKDE